MLFAVAELLVHTATGYDSLNLTAVGLSRDRHLASAQRCGDQPVLLHLLSDDLSIFEELYVGARLSSFINVSFITQV